MSRGKGERYSHRRNDAGTAMTRGKRQRYRCDAGTVMRFAMSREKEGKVFPYLSRCDAGTMMSFAMSR
jgi:hypothetical protein